jgi:hypothetical protein
VSETRKWWCESGKAHLFGMPCECEHPFIPVPAPTPEPALWHPDEFDTYVQTPEGLSVGKLNAVVRALRERVFQETLAKQDAEQRAASEKARADAAEARNHRLLGEMVEVMKVADADAAKARDAEAKLDAAEKELRKREDTIDWMLTDKRLAMERADAAEKRAERLEKAGKALRAAVEFGLLLADSYAQISPGLNEAVVAYDAALSGDGGQGRSEP